MRATYTSKNYSPDKVRARYVRSTSEGYRFCEVGDDRRFDIRQGEVEPHELPKAVADAADKQRGQYFGYVDWPINADDEVL